MMTRILLILSLAFSFYGCSTNPVTGENQFSIISASDEVAIGRKNYIPYQQQQGGQYVVDPELSLYVSQIGKQLAAVSDRPKLPYEFVVLNNDVPNAWALPGGKIAINRGLLVQLKDEAQLASVLAHEIVHAAARHGATQMTQQALLGLGVGAVGLASQKSEYGALITGGAAVGASAYQARYGRQQELDSDYYGMRYMAKAGYDPVAAVELQELFVKMSASRSKAGWLDGLFASHPPSQERVAKNRETASKLGTGVRNRTQFQNAIKQIVKDKKAYETHGKAIAAANKGNLDQSLSLTREAIRLQGQEPLFYVTQGKLYLEKKQFKSAETAFNKANKLYPEFYASTLGLGIAQYKAKMYSSAKASLTQSAKLLSTLTTIFYLGETALAQGNKAEAIQYYEQVAQTQNDLGKKAQERLQGLQENPATGQ